MFFFQYGRAEVLSKHSRPLLQYDHENDSDEETKREKKVGNGTCLGAGDTHARKNGVLSHSNDNTLISRDKLILLPDPSLNINGTANGNNNKKEMGDNQDDVEDQENDEVSYMIFMNDC